MEAPTAAPGHNLYDFIRIDEWLRSISLNAPEIYEADVQAGWAMLEDFGDTSFKTALAQGADAQILFGLGADILKHWADQKSPPDLPNYYDSHVHRRHRRVIDWYAPLIRGAANPAGLAQDYLNIWRDIESGMSPAKQGFLHIDFHCENLMWLGDQQGLARCGLLDFQGAMHGPLAYDLANLLEDARIDVDAGIKAKILSSYDESTQLWFRILATQFHCRVIGQFIKLAVEGKDQYLKHIPRLQNYLVQGLQDPVLAPLAAWFKAQKIDFTQAPDFSRLKDLPQIASEPE